MVLQVFRFASPVPLELGSTRLPLLKIAMFYPLTPRYATLSRNLVPHPS